jgi:hypothetical protein
MPSASGKKRNILGATPKERRNNIIVMVLILTLAVLLFLFFAQRSSNRQIIVQITAQKDSIQVELARIITGYDSLKVENDTLTERMYIAQTRVKDLLMEVEQTRKISFEQISMYQKQVTTLREIMRSYITQIDSLNRRNEILLAENLEVKKQAKQVESINIQLSQEKQELEQNLKKAAALEAVDILVAGLNDRSKETRFANRTALIRVNFSLSKNITAKRGAKNIYIRIMRPDQLLLAKSPEDLFPFEDLKIQYSAVREVNYEGNDLPVAIYWDNQGEKELIAGEYTVDIFADGNHIGTSKFGLK